MKTWVNYQDIPNGTVVRYNDITRLWELCTYYCSDATVAYQKDDVNKPEHYTLPQAASDAFSVMQQIGLITNYPVATAFKYLWRCNNKQNYLKDLKKARWFINKAIEIEESKHEAEHKTAEGSKNPGPGTNNK